MKGKELCKFSQNLKLRQSQSLVMTPQLQQAIKLLQLNNLELTNLVNKELEENPFLENESVELENQDNMDKEKTDELDESFKNGESIVDEPCNDDFENRWDNDELMNLIIGIRQRIVLMLEV